MQVVGAPGELYLDSLPLMTVGGSNGAERFGGVVGVGRLSDGGFVVGDGAEQRLRLYDSDGVLVRTVGGERGDSEEFVQLRWAGVLPGDTLIAFDWRSRKFSLFTRDGAFVRSFRLERSDIVRLPLPVAVLEDGSVLLDGSAMPAPPTRRVAAGVYVESTVVARVRTADGSVDSIASYPSRRVYRGDGGSFATVLPFSPRLTLASVGDDVIAGFGEDTQVTMFGATGRRTIDVPLPAREISRAAVEREREKRMANNSSISPQSGDVGRATPVPAHFPRYDALVVDDRHRVWVRAYSNGEDAEHWLIIDRSGVVADRATLPPRFDIVAVAGDHILGRWRDVDDAQYVGVFALRRR
ncbi:MAG TPA: hypothetical protein VFT57_10480 [Gemmatimonadaceae bacterium]|nr:hypothetical protein [Gemmatimonadaceae bacterium]